MFIRNLLIVSLFILISSCSGQKNLTNLVGLYKVEKKANYFNYFILNERYEANVNIEIKQDSTFIKKSCYGILNGKWSMKNDSLVLNVRNIEVLFTGEIRDEDYNIYYLIKKNKLINKEYDRKNKINVIEYLVKTE